MLDIKLLRNNPKEIEGKLKTKEPTLSLTKVLSLDEEIRQLKKEAEDFKSLRNQHSKEIGEKKQKGEDISPLLAGLEDLGEKITALDHRLAELEKDFIHEISLLPNLPMDDIKISPDPKDNVCIKTFGEKPEFSFIPKNHVELNESLGLFDFKRGTKLGGAGWPSYRGLGARLEWALINFMLDTHLNNGFEQWMPPLLCKPEIMYGCGQLPKFKDQLYKLTDKDYELYLIPTSEAALNGLHYDEILESEELPLKYVSYTPCFRREAGASGANERGLIRTHQFNKVEMFCLTHPEDSAKMFETMMAGAEEILQALNIHYRSMLLVTGDMSFSSAKTVDLEVWLPGQNRYYEVSSISNCTDYQARRSQIRYKEGQGKANFVHTLNGSGLATSRLMVAILENNQQPDGSVILPTVLHKYLDGLTTIGPKK